MKLNDLKRENRGVTLVETMIVVAAIGLLAALAIPGFVNARKLSQGQRIVNECSQMDAAINRWALATDQPYGAVIDAAAVQTYMKAPWNADDLLGNGYNVTMVGATQISINAATKTALYGVGI